MDLCKRRWKKIFFTAVIACLGLSLTIVQHLEAKADRYFVDYENNTGYYVDVNSIEIPSDHEVSCMGALCIVIEPILIRWRAPISTDRPGYIIMKPRN